MKTIHHLCTALFLLFFHVAKAQTGGNDIQVNNGPDTAYADVRVSVAYDGSIYLGRLLRPLSGTVSFRDWQVLKSVDNGVTFKVIHEGGVTSEYEYTAFDMLVAGNNAGDFRVFIARGAKNQTTNQTYLQLTAYNSTGGIVSSDVLPGSLYTYASARGYESIALATDSREPNSVSSPFSFSVVAIKADFPNDSIVVWTGNTGGTNLKRNGIHGTPKYLRKVSASIGSTYANASSYGALGIVWDEFENNTDAAGTLWVKYQFPDDGTPIDAGAVQIGTGSNYRNPCISLSQYTDGGAGPGAQDIRSVVIYEYVFGTDVDVFARVSEESINGAPDFSSNGVLSVAVATGEQMHPHMVYDVTNDDYLITYYDAETRALVYKKKALTSVPVSNPTTVSANYRQSASPMSAAFPRVDMGSSATKAVFAWNDTDSTLFDAEQSHLAVQELPVNLSEINVFPNPAQDLMTVSFLTESKETVQVRVTDMTGRVLLTKTIYITAGNNTLPVDVSPLPAGRYIVHINGKTANGSLSFVVLR